MASVDHKEPNITRRIFLNSYPFMLMLLTQLFRYMAYFTLRLKKNLIIVLDEPNDLF